MNEAWRAEIYRPLNELIPNSEVPEGEIGDARVSKFTVDQRDSAFDGLRRMVNGEGHRHVPPGTYTRLSVRGELWMSDTPAEKRDHTKAVRIARGHCLVFGLGLGLVAAAMARKQDVERITVVELNSDVIKLVSPHMPAKVEVITADALDFKPRKGDYWDVVWADIWRDISLDNRPQMTMFKRRFNRKWAGWVGVWADDEVARLRQQEYCDRNSWGWHW